LKENHIVVYFKSIPRSALNKSRTHVITDILKCQYPPNQTLSPETYSRCNRDLQTDVDLQSLWCRLVGESAKSTWAGDASKLSTAPTLLLYCNTPWVVESKFALIQESLLAVVLMHFVIFW